VRVIASVLAPQAWWWLTRATGLVAWVVVTVAMVWGLLASTRSVRRRGVPAWIADLHRYLGGLALAFTVAHLLTLVADSYVHFGARELFVPMASTWKPGPVAWGIAAFYALLVVQLSSWVMRRLPRRLWHRIHLASFGLFATSTVHGVTAGTDRLNRLVQVGTVVGVTWVASLVMVRVLARDVSRRERPVAAAPAAAPPPVVASDATDDRAARIAALAARRAERAGTRDGFVGG
jgi:hypothetical protein